MPARGGIELDVATMQRAVEILGVKTDAYLGAIIDYSAAAAERHMKENAPWTDRTANARSGLRAVPGHIPKTAHWIDLLHSVAYGIWLEIRWSGKYAIVTPSILSQGTAVMVRIAGLFRRLGGSAP